MAVTNGPKAKAQRRFGELLVPRPKYSKIMERRAYPPGQHGRERVYRAGRRSDFAQQLLEKQKLSFIYNIREKQMRRYFEKALKQTGATGENLLILLERRLDNLVYRAGFAATIWAARQMVSHRHVEVNGQTVNIPSYMVRPGDVITLKPKMRSNPQVAQWIEESGGAPDYLEVDSNTFSATLKQIPSRQSIPVPVREQLVVEYYNRRT